MMILLYTPPPVRDGHKKCRVARREGGRAGRGPRVYTGDKDEKDDDTDDTGKPLPIPVDVVIDDSTQTSEEAEHAAEERSAPVPTTEPKFNVTQWDK